MGKFFVGLDITQKVFNEVDLILMILVFLCVYVLADGIESRILNQKVRDLEKKVASLVKDK